METNPFADILPPGALWAVAESGMINFERNLTLMQKAIEPPGEAMPDWQIIARVACEIGFAHAVTYTSASEIFEEVKGAWNPKAGYDLRGASYERATRFNKTAVDRWHAGRAVHGARKIVNRQMPEMSVGSAAAAVQPVVLLWASHTGNAEDFAKRCASDLTKAGHLVQLSAIDDYPATDLSKAQNLLLISSTFGDGDAPDNGARFWSALNADNAPRLSGVGV